MRARGYGLYRVFPTPSYDRCSLISFALLTLPVLVGKEEGGLFLTPRSPRVANELPCEGLRSHAGRFRADQTSDHRVDASEPIRATS